jgi:hypothetical protein
LDDDFFSSIPHLKQKPSSGFQHTQRLAECGLFVGKEHDAELAHDRVKGRVVEGRREGVSLSPPRSEPGWV